MKLFRVGKKNLLPFFFWPLTEKMGSISSYGHNVLPTFALAFQNNVSLYLPMQNATNTPQTTAIPLIVIHFTSLNDFHVQQKALVQSALFQDFISISHNF